MARLRYLENARTGDPGTICTHTNKLFFDDTGAYINASTPGQLDLVATTITVTGNLVISGSITGAGDVIPYTTNYMGTLNVGVNDLGYDVSFYGATSDRYWKWDEGADGVVMKGTTSHNGNLTMEGTSSYIYFYDSGAAIRASAQNTLALTGTNISLTAGTTIILSGAITSNGKYVVTTGATGSYIDFVLDAYNSGTLINADTSGASFTDDVVGMLLNFKDSVTATSGKDIIGYRITLPALNASNDTDFVGFDLPEAGAVITNGNEFNWKGVNLKLPNTTETSGTLNVYGVHITGGTYGTGNEYGIYIDSIDKGIVIAGASAGNAIKIEQTSNTATTGYAMAIGAASPHLTTGTAGASVIKIYADTTATSGDNRGIYNRFYFKATNSGGGESLRSYTLIDGDYTVGTAHGAHISLGMGESTTVGNVSGLGIAVRATLGLASGASDSGGTYAAIMPEIFSHGSLSDAGAVTELSFIRCCNGGNSDGISDVDDDAFLLVLDGGSDATGKIFYHNTLRIKADSATKYIPLSTTQGTYTTIYPISQTIAALTAGDAYSGIRCEVTAADSNNAYGAAAYFQTVTSGTQAGHTYGIGSWINFDSNPTIPSYIVTPQDNGIYGTANMTDTRVIFGMRMEAVITASPAILCPFSINVGTGGITALFAVDALSAVSWVSGSPTSGSPTGSIPIICDNDGASIKYVHTYDSRS